MNLDLIYKVDVVVKCDGLVIVLCFGVVYVMFEFVVIVMRFVIWVIVIVGRGVVEYVWFVFVCRLIEFFLESEIDVYYIVGG